MTDPRPARLPRHHPERRARRRRRARLATLWSLIGAGLLSVALAVGVLVLIDQTMTAPAWLRDRVADRLESNLAGVQLRFGDIEMVVNKGWRPRLRLRDVVVSDTRGRVIVQLSDAEASLAMRPLLRGQMQPKAIVLTGAQVAMRRDTTGEITFLLGRDGQQGRRIESPAEFVALLDATLQAGPLSALTRVDLQALTLHIQDLRADRFWTVDGGAVSFDRSDDDLRLAGNFALLSGRAEAASLELNLSSRIGETAATFGMNIADVATQDLAAFSPALAWLQVLRAPVSGALRGSMDAAGQLGGLNATLHIGAGAVQPNDATRPIPFRSVRSYFTFDPARQVLAFDEVSVESEWVTATLEGAAHLGGLENGRLSELTGQLRVAGMALNPADMFPAPIRLDRVLADFRLRLDPFVLDIGQMQINDDDTRVQLDGRVTARRDGWDLAVDAHVDALTPERLIALWPELAVPRTRTWIATNLSDGTLADVNLAVRGGATGPPDVYLDLDFQDLTVKALRNLPPLTGVSGQATLVDNRFVVTAASALMHADEGGALDLAGTSFIVPDVGARGNTPAVARIAGRSSVTAAMWLLDRPPLRVLAGPGWPADLADGAVTLTGTLALPMKPRVTFDDLDFHARGSATDLRTEVIVPGHVLSAQAVQIEADQDGIAIFGAMALDDLPLRARWRQALGRDAPPGRVTGRAELSPRALATFGIGLPDGFLTGRGTADFDVNLARGAPPGVRVRSDLAGVVLRIPELGWRKPAGGPGALDLTATLGPRPRVDALRLEGGGLAATGRVDLGATGGLDRLVLDRLRLGDWLDVSGALVGRGAGRAPQVRIAGGTLDLGAAGFGGSQAGTAPAAGGGGAGEDAALIVALDSLRITDAIALEDFEGRFALAGGIDGAFSGTINGATPVTGRVVPRDGRSAIRIDASDAGGVFRDAGLMKQARGGDFRLTLQPVGAAGNFDGEVQVTDTRIMDAPAIAALLNAISVVGLLDELSGQGIAFSEVYARFRLSPARVTLFESSAVGASMGLTMDGIYDLRAAALDMQGVISPLYLVNGIGSILSRRGEGLIGFNYALTGAAQNPRVTVNPLSALTPGILRDVFRRTPPPQPSTSGPPLAPGSSVPSTGGADR
ncbi:MAG: hypothetical protein NXH82_08230 [Rhodobacteraceae bacterium]|nr:hypothetical protein [Paracoccaceae bacterium]